MDDAAHQRFGALTPAQIAALDVAAVALGVEIIQLMEVAGFQVARVAWRMLRARPQHVHVVAGHGNNGGDGLVAARLLASWGCAVTVGVLSDPSALNALMVRQRIAARASGVDVTVSADPGDVLGRHDVALTVDALLGTGLSEPPRPAHAEVIGSLAGAILSIDVPSGLDAGTATAPGAVVHAAATCTLTACKLGFWLPEAPSYTGVVHVADVGMPREAWRRCGLTAPTAVRGGGLRRVPVDVRLGEQPAP
jgi:NAD(P)H-hydrate epimerase